METLNEGNDTKIRQGMNGRLEWHLVIDYSL